MALLNNPRISGLLALTVVFLASSVPAQGVGFRDSALEIDRVEFMGTIIFGRTEVESALELTAGDRLDRQKVVRTAENLQTLYRLHGYEQMSVRSELLRQKGENGSIENVLKFSVKEGEPTRIARIDLLQTGAVELDPALRSRLMFRMRLAVGDVLDQDRIAAAKRNLQDVLASQEFIGARVDDVKVESAGPPPSSGNPPAARWVALTFRVDSGDRVTFGFRGNVALTRSQLLTVIEDQRAVGLGKDYMGSIRARIEQEYRSTGYAWVKVGTLTYEKPKRQERHVTFDIQEGPRVGIASVDFDGNSAFENERLRQEFFLHAPSLVKHRIYVEKDVEKAAELVIEWVKSQGYLAAKFVTISRTLVDESKRVRLLIYIYEGDQTIVQNVRLKGVTVFAKTEILKILSVQEGQPLNLFAFNEGIEGLKAAYRSRGYLEAKVLNEGGDKVIDYSRENRFADVHIDMDEGLQYRVHRIEVEGATPNRERVILRELAFGEGDVLEEQLIRISETRLRRLGIFSNVTIHGIDEANKPGYRTVRISVQEGTPGILGGGVGYRNDLGVRVFGQVAYTDVWRLNHTLALNGGINRRLNEDFCSNRARRQREAKLIPDGPDRSDCFVEYQAQLGYTWPWFALGDTTFRPSLTVEKTQFRLFDASSVALAATLERRLMKQVNLVGALTYSLESARQFGAAQEEDNQTLRIGALTPSLRLDLRDNSLAPTSGFFATTSFEWATPALGSRSLPDPPLGYTKFQFRADGYVPLFRDIVWYVSFRAGVERNTEIPPEGASVEKRKKYQIPLYKQFSLGGVGSLRGFSEQELNVQNIAILGTLSYVNYRTQIDVPFAGAMRFGPFLDAANLLVDRFSFGMLRYGAGVGFHYQTPVGSVNFDWGFKINPRPGEDPYRFYFSIGVF